MNNEQRSNQAQPKPTTDVHTYVHARLLALPIFARELLAGGLAGGLAKTAVAPLERTKIIFQTRGGNITVLGVLHHIWVTERIPGLFRGNTASVLRIVPYAAIHFGSYEYFRRAVVRLAAGASYEEQQQQHHSHPVWDLLAGSASGSSHHHLHHHHHHPGIWSMLASTAREEGFAGLYRGVTPTLLGILPYAGMAAWDVPQHRVQRLVHSFGPTEAPRLTTMAVTRKLLAAGGVRGLFRGLSINYMKVVPSTAIGFSVYDALKAYLGLTSTL
eukprot:gene8737-8917_t